MNDDDHVHECPGHSEENRTSVGREWNPASGVAAIVCRYCLGQLRVTTRELLSHEVDYTAEERMVVLRDRRRGWPSHELFRAWARVEQAKAWSRLVDSMGGTAAIMRAVGKTVTDAACAMDGFWKLRRDLGLDARR